MEQQISPSVTLNSIFSINFCSNLKSNTSFELLRKFCVQKWPRYPWLMKYYGRNVLKTTDKQNLCAKRRFTWTDPLRITVGSHGMIQCPFYCHHIKAECLRSFLSFYRLQNTSKTPKFYACLKICIQWVQPPCFSWES